MKQKVKTTALSLCGGFLLLFLGLFGGVYSLCAPFGLDFSPPVFFGLLFSALLSALVCSLDNARLRRLLTLLVVLFTLLCVWLRWDSVFLGAQAIFHKVSYGFYQELPNVFYYELPLPLTGEEINDYASLFVLVCAPIFSLWVGLWLLRPLPSLLGVLTLSALPGLSLFLLREPGTISLFAFLVFLALVALSHRGYRVGTALGGRRVLTAAVPLLLVISLLGLLFPQSSYSRPAWTEDLRLRLKQAGRELFFQGENAAEPGTYTFPRFGAPRFDGHTVLTLKSDQSQPQHILLRGWSSAVYTQYGWRGLSDQALDRLARLSHATSDKQSWSYPAHAILDTWINQMPDGALYSSDYHVQPSSQTLEISDVATSTDYYYTPYFPTSMYTGATFCDDSYMQRQERHFEYTFDFIPDDQVPDEAHVGWDNGNYYFEPDYREFVYRYYLDVPYDLLSDEAVEIIRELAQSASLQMAFYQVESSYAPPTTRAQRIYGAQYVAKRLADFTRYDLSTPAQPLGEDFVSYFLTDSHQGYCAHYATAATLILREMGIPARFVGGYAADLPGGSESVDVPDENAHAWVEIYIDGFGWQPVDVTPGGAFGPGDDQTQPSRNPTASADPSATPSGDPSAPSPSPSPSVAPSDTPQADGAGSETSFSLGPAATVLLCALAVLTLAGGVWLWRWLRLRRWRRQCTQPDSNAAARAMYRYLEVVEQRLGYPIPEEAFHLAQKAAFSQHILTGRERQVMEGFARQAREAVRQAPLSKRLWLTWFHGLP